MSKSYHCQWQRIQDKTFIFVDHLFSQFNRYILQFVGSYFVRLTYPVAAKNANDSFSSLSNCGMTSDCTGVGIGRYNSSRRLLHNSVNKPKRFHDNDLVVPVSTSCLLLLLLNKGEESSVEFLGIRKGIRDFDMADSSEEIALAER